MPVETRRRTPPVDSRSGGWVTPPPAARAVGDEAVTLKTGRRPGKKRPHRKVAKSPSATCLTASNRR